MPWNPLKSKKGKADKAGQPIKTGFHPIDLDALGKEDQGGSGDRKAGSGGGESGTADAARADPNAPPQAIAESPRSSASAEEEPLLAAYPEYGRDGLLSAAFTGNATVAKLMLELGTRTPGKRGQSADAAGAALAPLRQRWQNRAVRAPLLVRRRSTHPALRPRMMP